MASIASGTFNAFAFAGAGYLFKLFDKNGYEKEIKRHDLAIEKLTRERDLWNENRLRELDRVSNLRYNKQEAIKDISDINKSHEEVRTKFEMTKPKLSDYYKPSGEMSEYMTFVKFAATIPTMYALVSLVI